MQEDTDGQNKLIFNTLKRRTILFSLCMMMPEKESQMALQMYIEEMTKEERCRGGFKMPVIMSQLS